MNSNIKLLLAVICGIVIGLVVVQNNIKGPAMRELLKQQDEIAKSQSRIEQTITAAPRSVASDSQETIAKLQERVAQLETKMDRIDKVFNQLFQQKPQAPSEDLSKVYEIPVGNSPVRGKKGAPITIAAFSDFQCPYCGRFHPVVGEVLKAYPNDVNFVLKHFPLSFHPNAKPAAKAALAANEQGKYWEMVDALYANNTQLGEEKYKEIAKSLGMNVDKFMKDLKDKDAQWEEMIANDQRLGSQAQVRGTPTFFINGRKTQARDLNAFKIEIDQLLKEKK